VQMISEVLFRSTDSLTRMTSVLSFFFIPVPAMTLMMHRGDGAP
jgi:hypothetical protein